MLPTSKMLYLLYLHARLVSVEEIRRQLQQVSPDKGALLKNIVEDALGFWWRPL